MFPPRAGNLPKIDTLKRQVRGVGGLVAALLVGCHANAQIVWNSGDILEVLEVPTVGSSDTLNVASLNPHDFNNKALVNNGIVNWQAGQLRTGSSGGSFTNNGTVNDTANSSISSDLAAGGSFTNSASGTFNKQGSGTTTFASNLSFSNAGTFNVTQGILLLDGNGSLSGSGKFNTSSGATVRFHSTFSVPDATKLEGAGQYQLSSGTLTLSGTVNASNFQITGGILAGTHTFTNGATWSGGTWSSAGTTTNASGSTLGISNSSVNDFNGRAIVNNGIVNWSSGQLRTGGSGGSFTNNGTVNDTANSSINSDLSSGGSFTNAAGATYNKQGTGTTTFAANLSFSNAGTFNVTQGILLLDGGGSLSGSGRFNTSSGATVRFHSTFSVPDATKLEGAGQYEQSSGTLTLNGTVNASNFKITGGILAGTHTFANGATWSGGTWNSAGTTTNASGSTLGISNSSVNDFNSRAIVNDGTVNWSSGQLRTGGSGGSFTNNGTVNDTANSSINSDLSSGGSFTNAAGATFNKQGSGTTTFASNLSFSNAGTINVTQGLLLLDSNGSLSGAGRFNTSSGATVRFHSTFSVPDATKLEGAGQYEQSSGTLTLTGTVNASNFKITGGTLAGTHTFTNGASWSGGSWNSSGTTTNASGSTLGISNSSVNDFNGRAIINNGTVNWSSGQLRTGGSGGSFTNNGTVNDTANSSINSDLSSGGSFTNAAGATFNKQGTSTTTFASNLSFTNAGTIKIGAGTLSATSSLLLQSSSELDYQLRGPIQLTDFGLLSISGNLALNGTLKLNFGNGFQNTISDGSTFTIATGTSISGVFSNVANGARLSTADGHGSFQVNYGSGSSFAANSVVLSNFVPVPEPSTYALLITGGVLLFVFRRRSNSG